MTTQINLRLSEDFLGKARQFAKDMGFLNVQEFFREAAREKIYESSTVRKEYLARLSSKEASTFLSAKESKEFEKELKRKL